MDISAMPAPYNTVTGDQEYYADINVTYGETYYYRIGVFDNKEEKITDSEVSFTVGDANASVVSAGGFDLKARLMTGAEADPTVDENGVGSEWNRLIYRVHQDVPTDQVGDNWASYTDADIIVGSGGGGGGSATWTQETSASDSVHRGLYSLSYFYAAASDTALTSSGWRPALELIV